MLRHRRGGRASDGGVVLLHAARILAGEVRVQVDESGGQDAVAAVNNPGIRGRIDRIFRDGLDHTVDDQDVAWLQPVVHAVEDPDVFDQYRLRKSRSRENAKKHGHCNAKHRSPCRGLTWLSAIVEA